MARAAAIGFVVFARLETVSAQAPRAQPPLAAGDDAAGANPSENLEVSPWSEPASRVRLPLSHVVTRSDGTKMSLADLAGQPMAVSFVYTRCSNPNKCKRVTSTMADLRKRLDAAGWLRQVTLVLITYDANWDTLADLREYSARNGLTLDDHTMFLRPAPDDAATLYGDLDVRASFNPAGVTLHGIQLLLVDKAGRLARTYRTVIWNNDEVINDLRRLVNEPESIPAGERLAQPTGGARPSS